MGRREQRLEHHKDRWNEHHRRTIPRRKLLERHAGEDSDGDGLGDTSLPYNSGGGITDGGDHLPLVLPMCGDIDGDREIDTVDFLILLEYVVTGTSVDVRVGDIDGNGYTNTLDVRLLMGYINDSAGYSLNCPSGGI